MEAQPLYLFHCASLLSLLSPFLRTSGRTENVHEQRPLRREEKRREAKPKEMRGKLASICAKCMRKVSEAAVAFVLETVISFVATWCWNQTRIKEMRGNFVRLLKKIKRLNQKTDISNLNVNQLLSQLENEASEGIELLDGEPTPSQLHDAMNKFEQIRTLTQDLNELLRKNCRESNAQLIKAPPQVLKMKPPQFKPRYLRRRTRFEVLMNRKVSAM